MLRALLTLTSLQFALSGLASACSCVGSERPCEYLRSDYVFVGRVLATEPISHEEGRFTYISGYSMRFAVEESLRGDLGTRVNVETGSGGGDCGTPLEPGGTFLIFAYRGEDGSLRTGLCSGNQVLSGNPLEDELVAQYRSLIKRGKGTIFGRVSRMKPEWRGDDVADAGPPTIVEGLSLKAVSSTSSFSAKTGSNGSYEFAGLPKGEYTVTPEQDSAFDFDREYPDRYQVSLSEGQCANISFQLAPNTRIRGHVEWPKDLNLEHVEVVAIPTDMKDLNQFSGKWNFTDENHHFDLWPLPPGDYYVGVNINSSPKEDSPFPPTYYPGVTSKEAASVIHLREGDIKELELPLPEICQASLRSFCGNRLGWQTDE